MNLLCKIILFSAFLLNCFANAEEAAASLEIKKGGYDKPLLWFKPPEDVDKNTPVDVLVDFWKAVKERDSESAKDFCVPIEEFDNRPNRKSTINENIFGKYIESIINLDLKKILISEYPIKEKSGYWRVKILLEDSESLEKEYSVYLKIHDGKWKIQETSGWYEAAKGKRKPFGL